MAFQCWNCLVIECEFDSVDVKKYWFVTLPICDRSEREQFPFWTWFTTSLCLNFNFAFALTVVWSDISGLHSVFIVSYFSFFFNIRIHIRTDLFIKICIRQIRIFMNSVTSLNTVKYKKPVPYGRHMVPRPVAQKLGYLNQILISSSQIWP